MTKYKEIETGSDVYYALMERHSDDMILYERHTELFDEKNPGRGSTTMSFAIRGFDYPIIGKTSSWKITEYGQRQDPDQDKVDYWLYLPLKEK